ncbi:hypothetical protein IAQ61_000228 [Plenodomus lingam]|uniref:uncharacterized protein n=1 Tax=Leptosphaeria maculans TaxID=5022 RepID=UPI00332EDE72|nr:hypothetical protein IAQ61_000228 [Plenodomus lingam]
MANMKSLASLILLYMSSACIARNDGVPGTCTPPSNPVDPLTGNTGICSSIAPVQGSYIATLCNHDFACSGQGNHCTVVLMNQTATHCS